MIIAFLFVLINLLSLRNLPHSMSPHELPFGLGGEETGVIRLLFLHRLSLLRYVVIVGHCYLHPSGSVTFGKECAEANKGAICSSVKPAIPHPIRVTRKVSSGCCSA